jgi:hypothetical protein
MLPFSVILHHDNELGDAICLHIVLHHDSTQRDHVKSMKPSTVGIDEGHDVNGHDLCVEGVGVFEVVIPKFINNVAEKLGHALFGCLVTGVVIELGFVGSLCTNANDCCGYVSNCLVVEWETSRAYKFGTMVGFVLDSLSEDSREGVNPVQLVVGDVGEGSPRWLAGHHQTASL